MSAFVCGNEHINAIVNYVMVRRMSVPGSIIKGDYPWTEVETKIQAQRLGQFMVDANVASVNHNYGDSDKPYVFKFTRSITAISTVQFIKAIHCLDYQSCEVEKWEQTDACKLLVSLLSSAGHHLPGYDAAEWEIRK